MKSGMPITVRRLNTTSCDSHQSLPNMEFDVIKRLKTRMAIRRSVDKWDLIVNADGQDNGATDCALCALFNRSDSKSVCDGCPVKARTGRIVCLGTPFHDWTTHHASDHKFAYPRVVRCEECKRLAQLELDFLKSLELEGT